MLFTASNLPWDQEESSKGETTGGSSRHESFNHDEFVNVDHRLQLYLELKVFTSTENCQCVLHVCLKSILYNFKFS